MQSRIVKCGVLAMVIAMASTAVEARAEAQCQFTQGYWQNRAQNANDLSTEVWLSVRDQAFYLSGLSYRQVLLVPPKGNAYWILAHQLVAAQANYALGAQTPSLVSDALVRANQLMGQYTPDQIAATPKSSELRQELIALSRVLDDWNNALIGTGECGNEGTGGNG
jgi:hypothetical protein